MKKRKPKYERTASGLYPEQISNLRNMAAIRAERHQDGHNRLADFNECQEGSTKTPEEAPFIKEGQRVVVNGHEIHSAEEMAAALIAAYGQYSTLYDFEQCDITKNEQEPNGERERR